MSGVAGAVSPAPHTDLKHDTPMAALAMFGAIALVIGVPQQFLPFEAEKLIAAFIAAAAAAAVGAVDRDVSRSETAIAALLATLACASVDWRTGHLAPWSLEEIAIPCALSTVFAVLATIAARQTDIAASHLRRIVFALFIAGGILAVLVLGGLAVHRATGWKLTALPWLAGAGTGAFLAWRVPSLKRNDVCIGIFVAMLAAGVALVPSAPGEVPVAVVALIVIVVSTMMTALGGYVHHRVTKRLARRPLPTARVHSKA